VAQGGLLFSLVGVIVQEGHLEEVFVTSMGQLSCAVFTRGAVGGAWQRRLSVVQPQSHQGQEVIQVNGHGIMDVCINYVKAARD
jgi:hypothetical protein